MIGTVTKAFIEALRASDCLDSENISVVIANDNGEGIVNTALPAVAVSVKGADREVGEFIGGMIEQRYVVQLAVITLLDNTSASPDDDHQYDAMDLHYKIMLYINSVKHSDHFRQLMENHDFSINFRGVETDQTRGMQSELESEMNVHRLIYVCEFLSKETGVTPGAILEGVEMHCQCAEVLASERSIKHPNIAYSNGS